MTKIEEEKIIQDKIRYHIEKRCTDFHDNPSKMINSLLDRHKKKIVIDRLFVSENNNNYIILDPDEVRRTLLEHGQEFPSIQKRAVFFSNVRRSRYSETLQFLPMPRAFVARGHRCDTPIHSSAP